MHKPSLSECFSFLEGISIKYFNNIIRIIILSLGISTAKGKGNSS